jgi:hypothetical protein
MSLYCVSIISFLVSMLLSWMLDGLVIFFEAIYTWKKIKGRIIILLLYLSFTESVNQLRVNEILYFNYQSKFQVPILEKDVPGHSFQLLCFKTIKHLWKKYYSTANIVCEGHLCTLMAHCFVECGDQTLLFVKVCWDVLHLFATCIISVSSCCLGDCHWNKLLLSPATMWLKKTPWLMCMLAIFIAGILFSFQLFSCILEIVIQDMIVLCWQCCCITCNNLAFKSESWSG